MSIETETCMFDFTFLMWQKGLKVHRMNFVFPMYLFKLALKLKILNGKSQLGCTLPSYQCYTFQGQTCTQITYQLEILQNYFTKSFFLNFYFAKSKKIIFQILGRSLPFYSKQHAKKYRVQLIEGKKM